MQIVIPMSGQGDRFKQAGYTTVKPLIEMDGKPIIEYVVNMFPQETKFLFICNEDHLNTTNMCGILEKIAPTGTVVGIASQKKGPVYAVSKAFEYINENEEIIINYCDFSVYWNYQDFLAHTRSRNADGAVPAYKGFHPHMMGSTNYAFMKDDKQWMVEIKEKEPFTDNRMNEYASSGTYYFKQGSLVKKYFTALMEQDSNLNGEYYVSLIYNLLKKDGLTVSIYELQHMLQWGTPQDVEEYQSWSQYFKDSINYKKNKTKYKGTLLVPMAGAGKRFADEGYVKPKPCIAVNGMPMVIQSTITLPDLQDKIFVCQQDLLENSSIKEIITTEYDSAKCVPVSGLTQGQACTCDVGMEGVDLNKPLLISSCDNKIIINKKKWDSAIQEADVLILAFINNYSAARNPQMYGWIKCDADKNVTGLSVKKAISDTPLKDYGVIGSFYFSKAQYFKDTLQILYKENIKVNNEFYVDSCMEVAVQLGLKVKVFEVDYSICFGTPTDLRTYEYWQSFFSKCAWHPYTLIQDSTVNPSKITELQNYYAVFNQPFC